MKKCSKLMILFCILLASALFLSHNYFIKAADKIPVTDVAIYQPDSFILKMKTKLKLKATVLPTNATNKKVSWESSDTSIAKVSSSGVVTPVSEGEATITVTTKDGEFTKSIDLTVVYPAKKITLDQSSLTLEVNETELLSPSITPTNATNQEVEWTSSNGQVATVTDGYVQAIAPGTAIITARLKQDTTIVASVEVIVPQHVESVSIVNKDNISKVLKKGSKVTLAASVSPTNATNKAINWYSSNTAIAKISSTGVITPVSPGEVTITAASADDENFKDTQTFQVVYAVTGITLDKSIVTINKEEKTTLTAKIQPTNATNKEVTWKSLNENIAKVEDNGTITAIGSGTTTIYAYSKEDSTIFAKCVVVVPSPVTGIKITNTDTTLKTGSTLKLKTTFEPTNATTKDVTWYSSDTKVAKVDSNGVVTPLSEGNVTITVKTDDGGYTASITLTVIYNATSITLDKSSVSMKKGQTVVLLPTIKPSSADKGVTWKSSKKSVVTVDDYGTITAVGLGTAVITATSAINSTLKAQCKVSVEIPVTNLSIKNNITTLATGKAFTLTPVITPSNATNKTVTWQSSDTSIAKVDSSGTVTGVSPGEVTIFAVSKDGDGEKYTASKTLTIIRGVTAISINKTELSMKIGTSDVTLKATISPSNATDKTIAWKSSSSKVAAVDVSSGVVQAIGPGTATITAYSLQDPSMLAKCVVTVISPVTGVSLSSTTDIVDIGKSITVKANIQPSNASNKNVVWSTSNEAVATVSTSGSVKGVAPGTVKITAITEDGSYKGSITLTVINGIKSFKLDESKFDIRPNSDRLIQAIITPTSADYSYNKGVTWSSSDESIAKVSSSGLVHAIKSGKVTITATSVQDTSKTAKCTVTVITPVEGVLLTSSVNQIKVGASITLKPTFTPTNPTIKTVTWSSSDESIATVSSSGVVKGIATGPVVITVTTDDGNYSADILLTVIE